MSADVIRFRRRGYALFLVLGMVAVASILGLSFALKTAPAVPVAANRVALLQAQYLAGSGVAVAARFLLHPPSSIGACSFWTGTGSGGISIDGSSNSCVISVVKSAIDGRIYTVTSTATIVDAQGVARSKRTVTADLVVPPADQHCVQRAYRASTSQTLPSMLSFYGDMFVNGNISSSAWSQSVVAASGTVSWGATSTYGPPSSILQSQQPKVMPTISPSDYSSYTIDGTAYYTGATYSSQDLTSGSSPTNGGVITSSNPGGILISTNGSAGSRQLRLRDSVTFQGTLVVDGSLELKGDNVVLTAVSGYPAVVVSKDFLVTSDNPHMTINGAVLVGGTMRKSGGNKTSFITINGPLITNTGVDVAASGSTMTVLWTSGASTFYNFPAITDRQPYTIMRWSES